MSKKNLVAGLLCLFLLCGCNEAQDVSTPIVTELRPITTSVIWDGLNVADITPCSAMEIVNDELTIFPYNNNDAHINVKKIFISSNQFWDTVTKTVSQDSVVSNTNGYSYVTVPTGVTYGYLPIDEETAILVETTTLPSSYVELVLRVLCNAGT